MAKALKELESDEALEAYVGERIAVAVKERLAGAAKSDGAAKARAADLEVQLATAKEELEAAKQAQLTDLQKAQREAEKALKRAEEAERVAAERAAEILRRDTDAAVRQTLETIAPNARGKDHIVALTRHLAVPGEKGGFTGPDGIPLDKALLGWLSSPENAFYIPDGPKTAEAPKGAPARPEPADWRKLPPSQQIALAVQNGAIPGLRGTGSALKE